MERGDGPGGIWPVPNTLHRSESNCHETSFSGFQLQRPTAAGEERVQIDVDVD